MSDAYIDLGKRIVKEGVFINNKRTNTRCLTVINHEFIYNVGNGEFPILTTKQVFWKSAIAELLGYIRGYTSAKDFRELGTKSWDANANLNPSWLANPNRKGVDDMGYVYGSVGRECRTSNGNTYDQLQKIVNNLTLGIDDRGEILTYLDPGEEEHGCLRPCLFMYIFSIIEGTLHMQAVQR